MPVFNPITSERRLRRFGVLDLEWVPGEVLPPLHNTEVRVEGVRRSFRVPLPVRRTMTGPLRLRLAGYYDQQPEGGENGAEMRERYCCFRTVRELVNFLLTREHRGFWFYAHAGGLADMQFVLDDLLAQIKAQVYLDGQATRGTTTYSPEGEMTASEDRSVDRQGRSWKIRASFSGSSAIIVHVSQGKNAWHFVDSYWLLRDKLANIGKAIGIKKGKPFEPDARMKKILTEAVAIGNATARAITFSPRSPRYYFYPDRRWNSMFTGGGNYAFYDNGERMLDDRIFMHYYATGITPAMTAPKVGQGSVYGIAAQDVNGDYLDGGKTYSVTLPGPVPAKDFWSFMVYDSQHRSMLETDQKLAGLDSLNPSVKPNADGSYTMWFGPRAPEGKEGNWIQTMPGKSYHVLLRLYGPLQPWFDKTWKPGDFELVK